LTRENASNTGIAISPNAAVPAKRAANVKPENRHYFAGAAGKQRVYEWRQKYPNRRKRGPKAAPVKAVLQDLIDTQRIERLKELCPQEPVLQEMIDHLAGWLLQQGHLTQQGGRSDGHPTSVGS